MLFTGIEKRVKNYPFISIFDKLIRPRSEEKKKPPTSNADLIMPHFPQLSTKRVAYSQLEDTLGQWEMQLLTLATSICDQNEWSTSFRQGDIAGDGWLHSFSFGDLVKVQDGSAGFKHGYSEGVVVRENTKCYVYVICRDGLQQKKLKKNLEQVHLRTEPHVEVTAAQLETHSCENIIQKGVKSVELFDFKLCEPPSGEVIENFEKGPTGVQQKLEQNAPLKLAGKTVAFKPSAVNVARGLDEVQKRRGTLKDHIEDRDKRVEVSCDEYTLGADLELVNAKPSEPPSQEVEGPTEVQRKPEQDTAQKAAETPAVCKLSLANIGGGSEEVQKRSDILKDHKDCRANIYKYSSGRKPIQTFNQIKSHCHSKKSHCKEYCAEATKLHYGSRARDSGRKTRKASFGLGKMGDNGKSNQRVPLCILPRTKPIPEKRDLKTSVCVLKKNRKRKSTSIENISAVCPAQKRVKSGHYPLADIPPPSQLQIPPFVQRFRNSQPNNLDGDTYESAVTHMEFMKSRLDKFWDREKSLYILPRTKPIPEKRDLKTSVCVLKKNRKRKSTSIENISADCPARKRVNCGHRPLADIPPPSQLQIPSFVPRIRNSQPNNHDGDKIPHQTYESAAAHMEFMKSRPEKFRDCQKLNIYFNSDREHFFVGKNKYSSADSFNKELPSSEIPQIKNGGGGDKKDYPSFDKWCAIGTVSSKKDNPSFDKWCAFRTASSKKDNASNHPPLD